MPAATSLPTTVAAGTTGHVGHTNTVHGAVNALTVVAASSFNVKDTPYSAKGDGSTDDRAAIQAAINAANAAYVSTGAVQDVVIPAGVYIVGSVNYIQDDGATSGITSLKLLNGVNLIGSGTLKVPSSAYGSGAYYRVISSRDGSGSGVRLSNASISGITVDGNRANQVASGQCDNIQLECAANVTVDGVRSINANGNAIMLRGTAATNATNLQVRNCTVLNASTIGIQASQFDGLVIDSNYISDTADNNIDIYGDDGTAVCHGRNFVISNNVCKNSGLVGIFPETVRDGVVTGNTISGCASAGIHVNRINGAITGVTISGNTVTGCANGVFVSGDTDGVTVVSNTIRDFSASAIHLGTGGGNVSRVMIMNNVFIPPNYTTYLIVVVGNQAAFIKSFNNACVMGSGAYFLSNTATTSVACLFEAPTDSDS